MIALPGGSWCHFCNREICFNGKHRESQYLLIAISKLINDLVEERNKK